MYSSGYRIKKQWNEIKDEINNREDFIPFNYCKTINIQQNGKTFKVKNRREFYKTITEIMGKYGKNSDIKIDYIMNYGLLVDTVEKKAKKLLKS